jgi:hypothetical protein
MNVFPSCFLSDGFSKRWAEYIRRSFRDDLLFFINSLNDIGNVVIFGGVVRDFFLKSGFVGFKSDIDLVLFDSNEDELNDVLSRLINCRVVSNKFGGFRVYFKRSFVDIWLAERTWAFQSGACLFEEKNSLLRTTFFNLDSIFYDITLNKVVFSDLFEEGVLSKTLGVQLLDNPNPVGCLRRAIKYSKIYGYRWSYDLSEYALSLSNAAILLHGKDFKITPDWSAVRLKDKLDRSLQEHCDVYFSKQMKFDF